MGWADKVKTLIQSSLDIDMLQSLCILCSILISTRHHDSEGWNSNGGAPAMQSYGGGGSGGMQHQVMDCAKAFVGS